jgi:hypothetical protein
VLLQQGGQQQQPQPQQGEEMWGMQVEGSFQTLQQRQHWRGLAATWRA